MAKGNATEYPSQETNTMTRLLILKGGGGMVKTWMWGKQWSKKASNDITKENKLRFTLLL